jgi:hypothetical protein
LLTTGGRWLFGVEEPVDAGGEVGLCVLVGWGGADGRAVASFAVDVGVAAGWDPAPNPHPPTVRRKMHNMARTKCIC